jgi:hypothetical protein
MWAVLFPEELATKRRRRRRKKFRNFLKTNKQKQKQKTNKKNWQLTLQERSLHLGEIVGKGLDPEGASPSQRWQGDGLELVAVNK